MDETRAQDYLQLIQTLLNCPNGDEPQILQDNSELLDSGFLETCESVAAKLAAQGGENGANFLRNLASQLGQFIDMNDDGDSNNSEGENRQEYANFFLDLLQAEASSSNTKVIYSMLAEREHLLNPRFTETLQQVSQILLHGENPKTINSVVSLIENLSIHINQFPRGNKANNIEIAITGHQIVLNNLEPGSENFAATQNNLAIAYSDKINGSRAENLERAIEFYQAALTVRTREAFPEHWATTKNNLANTYNNRINGSRADNLERAIEFYQAALTVRTREAFPEHWATTKNNLANTYSNRINGSRADNLERAIEFYQAALTILTREVFPEQWALTKNNLAAAYSNRINGSRADNLERAIEFYQAALTVRTHDAFPQDWAETQNNLAAAYSNRINGSRAENLERAIEFYQAALTVHTREAFPEQWATTKNNLANTYSNRINGSRADNLERAIEFYQAALTVRTHDAFPEQWAETKNNLAAAYGDIINGSRSEKNQENVANFLLKTATQIASRYENFILELLLAEGQSKSDNKVIYPILTQKQHLLNARFAETLQQFSQGCIADKNAEQMAIAGLIKMIQNLSVHIMEFPRGNRANNLEIAITGYQIVLNNQEPGSEYWATIQNNLAIAYSDRINGSRAENLERAIEFFQAALTIFTLEDFPEQWALTQNNLAATYRDRINGSRADNLERAIEFCQVALTVFTFEDFPEKWAMIQKSLANSYLCRIKGARADNLERAIEFDRAALTVCTREDFPEDWAQTQNNLAVAYLYRIKGARADNLEQAIECCQELLTVRTREYLPEKWANTQNNLAIAYKNRINGSKADNLERAIEFYQAALTVRTRENFPEKWAETQHNLANVYSERINGSRAENLERAIKLYHNALTIRTREAFPQNHTTTLSNLGNLYHSYQQWQLAYDTYAPAIETVEFLRGEIQSGDETKQKLAEEWNNLYLNMVEVCLKLKNYTAAIEYVERSKARNLVELLATRDLYPKGDIPETVINELSRLRREIDAEQRRLEIEQINRNSKGGMISETRFIQETGFLGNRTNINQLQQQLNELIIRDIEPIDPDFSLTQKVKSIPYSEIQSLTGENTAILEWYITGDKFITFIITPQSPTPIIWQSSTADFEALVNWDNEYQKDDKDYKESKAPNKNFQWKQRLASRLQKLAEILHLDKILEKIPNPKQCDRLILIPHRFLHLFALHALPVSKETWLRFNSNSDRSLPPNPYLLDCFVGGVSYAPSCQLLQQAKQRQRPNFSHLFAIANPTKDRYLLELQAANIRYRFKSNDFLAKDDANKNAILNGKLSFANCAHFGCHAKFEPDSPLKSALKLANHKPLTLLEILNLDLNQCRLVTLSACETGLTESKTSDEYIGLPFGFLLAGSPSIVSTLWEVDQLASTLLLMRFYENLETLSTVTALNEAQQWLRDLTSEGLKALWECLKPQIDQVFYQMPPKERTRYVNAPFKGALNRKPFPFAEPHYWAGFTAIGV